jgi:hypothetical protein
MHPASLARKYKMIYLEVKVYPDSDIHEASRAMLQLANKMYIDVHFEFNGVELIALPVFSTKIEDAVIDLTDRYYYRLRHRNDS